ncbi:MAG: response regulator [Anaerolineales bacterium]|nr:MAG: response regulator [Anaerolineales bacterium]
MNDMKNLSQDAFSEWVRDALKSLYDSPYLESHPLVDVLVPPENRTSRRSQDLRKVLINAIQAMKPGNQNPPESRDWRSYQILELRFIAGHTTSEVLQLLNISRSLMFQEQAYALQSLINRLWEQHIELSDPSSEIKEADENFQQTPDTEILRLLGEATWEVIELNTLITDLQSMLSAIAGDKDVSIDYDLDEIVIVPAADRVLLRLLLMAQIGDMALFCGGGRISLSTINNNGRMGVCIICHPVAIMREDSTQAPDFRYSSATYDRLMLAMGGALEEKSGQSRSRCLVWNSESFQQTLLLIDDHIEIEALFNRYLSGSNWQVVAAFSGEQARELLLTVKPDIIFLDVILPQEDGWELLQRFRANPETKTVPIIVCSVIYEPQLLQTLGASGYVRKPVTQIDLYEALRVVRRSPHG